ncbi:MAG TPA: sugar-binding domain-containing protein [Actinomycetota bacterium]|nr:sugar-binding domain-containing protein [Actinomycetota bacterium]
MDAAALDEQATRAAFLYYLRGLNQEQIARRMGVSRSTVSRLLSHAREVGIVEITVTRPLPEVANLEAGLHERFPLQVVVVEPRDEDEPPSRAAARAGARFLSRRARAGGVVGVGWGLTLRAAAEQVVRGPVPGLTLVDVVGRPPADDSLVAVSRVLARAWGAEAVPIPAPAFAAPERVRQELLRNPVVKRALARAREADLIVVSVGGVDEEATLVREGVVSSALMARLRAAGAVGDLLGHFFDASGREVQVRGLASPIGLGLEDLRSARLVVAVAAGEAKVAAIRAAASSGLIGGLVTDETTARALLG